MTDHDRLGYRPPLLLVTLGAVAVGATVAHVARAAGAAPDVAPSSRQGPGCTPMPYEAPDMNYFADISDASGIRDENFDPDPPTRIPINDHSRLAFADINGDDLDDIVAHSLFPNPEAGIPFEHLVFANRGDGTFSNISDASGLRDVQSAFFAFGDVDNDGDQDAFAGLDIPLAPHTHQMLMNDGAGRFTPLPDSGVEGRPGQTTAGNAVFADFDGDAVLDLFVGNGHTRYAAADRLYLGNGDGTFRDASSHLGNTRVKPSNGSVTCDYDLDGDQDIFVSVYGVSHELGANVLWENDGTGRFHDVAVERGFASLATGNYYMESTGEGRDPEPGKGPGGYVGSNGFGLACQDVTGDGLPDVFLSAISHPDEEYTRKWSDPSQLLVNMGPEEDYAFANEFLDRGLPFNEGDVDGGVADFDNDGRLDLSLSRDRKYEGRYQSPEQKAWFGLMHQRPDGMFRSVGRRSGINDLLGQELLRMKSAQNHVWSDIDLDGDVDLLVGGRGGSAGRPNFLFENLIGERNAWLGLRLEGDGVAVNRDAIGARVAVDYGDEVIVREVQSSRGMYNSMDSRAVLFGLGERGCEFDIAITWPDGSTAVLAADDLPFQGYARVGYDGAIDVIPTPSPAPSLTPKPEPTATPTDSPTPTAAPRPAHIPRALAGARADA